MKTYLHVTNHWNDADTAKLAGVDRLVYRSNKLGADQRITNTGGGNTSSKISETDPLTGEQIEVLWVIVIPDSSGRGALEGEPLSATESTTFDRFFGLKLIRIE